MPIFEYQCQKCSLKFEELIRSHSQEQSLACPSCSSAQVAKQISLFGFSSHAADGSTTSSSSAASCGTCASGNCAHCH